MDSKKTTGSSKKRKSSKTKEIHVLKVSEVIAKEQIRKEFTQIDELAVSIISDGQQSPIIVSPANKAGKFEIQKGERRWRACVLANIKTIDVIINRKRQTKAQAVLSELIENMQRQDLTPLEAANGFKQLIDEGWTQKDIADKLGKKRAIISRYLSLLDLPECVFGLYEEKVCLDIETLNNLRLLHGHNKQKCISVCADASVNGITRIRSREILNEAKERREATVEDTAGSQPTFSEMLENIKRLSEEKVFRATKPAEVNIGVTFSVEGKKATGRLFLDRVSDDGVWISTESEEGAEQILFFPTSQVKITQISA